MSRLSIRLRVTLSFTAAIALVLAGFGLFLYLRSSEQLDESVDDTLELRAADLAALVTDTDANRVAVQTLDPEDSFAQVLTTDGRLVLSTAQLGTKPVLSAAELAAAAESETTLERDEMPAIDGRVRALATPISTDGEQLVAVVGTSLEDRDESLRSLAFLLLIGGPAALALAAAAGYWAAGRALSPVERMRRQAADIGSGAPGGRLAVPGPDDELRRLGLTLNEMLGRLEGAIERERQFVDDASHELRTPLALHKTELELAQRYAEDETELRAAIASGIEEVDRLAQLADDLLVVARSGEDGLALNLERLEAAELLDTVATRFRSRIAGHNRTITTAAEAGLTVWGDRLRLEQALTNLVENAVRHGAGEIRLAAVGRGDAVRLSAGDEGAGFADDFLPHAFERFSRGDAARGRGGAGLGLAIVDTIAMAHGGSAGARNPTAGGPEIWIDVPASGPPRPAAPHS